MAAINVFQASIERQYRDQKHPIARALWDWEAATHIAKMWMTLIDLNEPAWNITKLYSDEKPTREHWNQKVLYYQKNERVPFQYRTYKTRLLKRAKEVAKAINNEKKTKDNPDYDDQIDKCDSVSEFVR